MGFCGYTYHSGAIPRIIQIGFTASLNKFLVVLEDHQKKKHDMSNPLMSKNPFKHQLLRRCLRDPKEPQEMWEIWGGYYMTPWKKIPDICIVWSLQYGSHFLWLLNPVWPSLTLHHHGAVVPGFRCTLGSLMSRANVAMERMYNWNRISNIMALLTTTIKTGPPTGNKGLLRPY